MRYTTAATLGLVLLPHAFAAHNPLSLGHSHSQRSLLGVGSIISSVDSLLSGLTSALTTTPATIGPIASLPIVNKVIAPDGYSRSSVVAGGKFPGPLITGYKVLAYLRCCVLYHC